jgi:hypothetical protein
MSAPIKLNFDVYQGGTFKQILRWESDTKVYVPITNIAKSAPVSIVAAQHGIPDGWRARVTSVSGMKEINNTEEYYQVTPSVNDPNLLTINGINSLNYTPYISGGVLEYNKPVNLTGITGRLVVVENISSTTLIYAGTSANGGVEINQDRYTITIKIPAAITETFTFLRAVYELSLINAQQETIPFATGFISVEKGAVV